MVLSVSAIIGAREPILYFYETFATALNGVPIRVQVFSWGERDINVMRAQELEQNWADYLGQFVRFTGVVESAETGFRMETVQVQKLTLKSVTIDVYPQDARNLPETYERGHKYEFTGLLVGYESHAEDKKSGYVKIRVHAFQIRHREEAD